VDVIPFIRQRSPLFLLSPPCDESILRTEGLLGGPQALNLNSKNVPPEVVTLLPLAEKWGIGDDFERERQVAKATVDELETLALCYENMDVDALFSWLEGPDAKSSNPSEEYLAFTCLTMGVDSARAKLENRAYGRSRANGGAEVSLLCALVRNFQLGLSDFHAAIHLIARICSELELKQLMRHRLVCLAVGLLSASSACAFRWGGAPDFPVAPGTRVVVDGSSTLASAASAFFAADNRFVLLAGGDHAIAADGSAHRCFAASAQADLVVRLDESADIVGLTVGDSGRIKGVQVFPDTLRIGSWRAVVTLTLTFTRGGECSPVVVRKLVSTGAPLASRADAEEDERRRQAEILTAAPALLAASLGNQGTVVASAEDRATVSIGQDRLAVGDIVELSTVTRAHLGTAAVTGVADAESTIVAIGGEAPRPGMLATQRSSASSIELLPTVGVFSNAPYLAAGARVEWHKVLRSPMLGVELSAGGKANVVMPSAYVGYLWEPRPRWLGLYAKLGVGALLGSADAALQSASIGVKLRTAIALFDLESGYFISEPARPLDTGRWGSGPFLRVGVGLELR
jgi:hypothetical protein